MTSGRLFENIVGLPVVRKAARTLDVNSRYAKQNIKMLKKLNNYG